MQHSVWLGWDPREHAAFEVARSSCKKYLTRPIPIRGLVLDDLRERGLYSRPMEYRASAADKPIMWDVVSDAPMATEFACSRFLTPMLARSGWALFADCDMLFRSNVARLFEGLEDSKAVYCVKHDYQPKSSVKMDGQVQGKYSRKLWSSFAIFNADHPANRALTVEFVNRTPGRDLHAFNWLADDEIGEISPEWNWIPGHSSESIDPKCVHFSEGGPWFPGYEDVPFADEWRQELRRRAV